jgi:acetyl esterase/lipase
MKFMHSFARRVLLIFLVLGTSLVAAEKQKRDGQRPARPARTLTDVKYGPHERNVLDLWRAESDEPAPLVVFIHGGGFHRGSKEQIPLPVVTGLLSRGISVMAINYRLSPEVSFPAHYMDCARAIQFARSKAKEWNIDPTRIGSTGGSAGAGTALWLGFHDDMADPANADPILRQSTRLAVIAVWQAQSTYDPRVIKEWVGPSAAAAAPLLDFFGIKSDDADTPRAHQIFEACSAINYLTRDDPPVYAYYSEPRVIPPNARAGTGIHHVNFGLRLKDRMDPLGIECVIRHRDQNADRDGEMVEFFVRHLRPPTSSP